MSGTDATEFAKTVIERWGFPVLACLAAGWVLRNDVLIPLVKHHEVFLTTITKTQAEIADAVHEQTKLLYALQAQGQKPRDEAKE